jgi:glycosyltransferase involved in cell wall biosynthesis
MYNSRSQTLPIGLAIIVGQLGLGGAEQQLYYLLSGLDRSRFHPIVITLGPTLDEYWVRPIKSLDIRVCHVGKSLGRAGRIIQIARLLRSEKIQFVHSWDLHTNPYSVLARRLAGVVLCLGSMRLDYHGIPGDWLLRWAGYRGLEVLVTNSATAANQVQEYQLTKAPVRLVCNGVYIPEPVTEFERYNLKSELGFSKSDLVIGSIGRFDRNKNHAMLLRAFASLAHRWKMLRLVIIGEGPLRIELAAMAESLGIASRLSFPGPIPLASRLLPALDVCCLTSYTEGMPNLVMEAAAAGLPVVSTRCGDSVKLIEHGVSGYLVSVDDDTNLRSHLNALMADPASRVHMGQAGREKMRREFSLEIMVARMTQVYEEALADKIVTNRERTGLAKFDNTFS